MIGPTVLSEKKSYSTLYTCYSDPDMATKTPLKIAFIGAGHVNFGGAEGPWDHATRLEQMPGISALAIVDPITDKAEAELQKKKSGKNLEMYRDCVVLSSVDDLLKSTKVDAVIVGTPPGTRGSLDNGLELQLLKAGIHSFIEKPLSVTPPEPFADYVAAMEKAAEKSNAIFSVGYMFRYHAAVVKMKELIAAHGGKVMAFNARYFLAYSEMDRPFWWDITKSGGPIIEQATHFCDLARYLVGDVDLSSIQATCLRDSDPSGAGKLARVNPPCEVGVPPENCPQRVSAATWHFKDGGIGSLMHVIALHGQKYESHIDVLMDGLRMTLYEPYHPECVLKVRKSGSDQEEILPFGDADPYTEELDTFVKAVRTGDSSAVKSSYADAAKTYNFTWAIQRALQ